MTIATRLAGTMPGPRTTCTLSAKMPMPTIDLKMESVSLFGVIFFTPGVLLTTAAAGALAAVSAEECVGGSATACATRSGGRAKAGDAAEKHSKA